ncbi:MAG: diguanylate phosphodiesterase, partial [Deltaproteobacteria bacterium]
MEVFVARQPIFDHQQKVYGYELLYRSRNNDNYDETNGDRASLKVIENFLFITGIEKLTGGKRAFINFTKNLLLEGIAFKLPPKFLVIEILEDVDPNEEIITVCHELKRSGYLLALDDFVLKENGSNPLLNLIDILKVDIQLSSEDEVEATTQKAKEKRIKLLAEKTETLSEFEKAKKLGYNYFQGYFFSKPKIIARKDIPASKIAQLELLQEINRPELDLEKLEKIVKKDTSLTFKLLKYINSAFFGLYQPVTSIKKALIMVGESELRKWGSLIILTS